VQSRGKGAGAEVVQSRCRCAGADEVQRCWGSSEEVIVQLVIVDCGSFAKQVQRCRGGAKQQVVERWW
jgi:hypothetical protein